MIQARRTTPEDIKAIMVIVRLAQEDFKARGIDQWQNGYPDESVFIDDMESNNSYVFTLDGVIVATAMISFDGEKTYNNIDGKWLSDNAYVVIHRIAVRSDMKGRNIAGQILSYTKEMASARGINSIRIDTHHQNLAMQRVVSKFGFTYCGIITLEDGALRLAYQLDF
ncbi:MAG: GNAT family N-acetyltransferase [Bacteroidales bacterium]